MKAIEKILAIKGVENMKPAQSDLGKFLEQKGVTINNLNVTIPAEYAKAMEGYEVVEGEYRTAPKNCDITRRKQ